MMMMGTKVEAGGEGVAQLVQMLGFGPGAKEEPTQQVGILGYEGTGKKSLLKALRREAPGSTRWLLESVGRLRPADDPEGEAAAAAMLHMATRGLLARGRASEGQGSNMSNMSVSAPSDPLCYPHGSGHGCSMAAH